MSGQCKLVKCPKPGCGAICNPVTPGNCSVYVCPKCPKVNNKFQVNK